MTKQIPEDCKINNQKAFTITVSKEQAKLIQAALNRQFRDGNYDQDNIDMLSAQEFVEDVLYEIFSRTLRLITKRR